MKTSFKTRVLRMGLRIFVNISIFVMKYYFFQFVYILHFFESLKSKSTQILRPQKGNLGVSFNDTLLNFGLCHTKLLYPDIQPTPRHKNLSPDMPTYTPTCIKPYTLTNNPTP